ncbi:MAG TPA: hypothetical protein VFX59_13430, partial [Polyangiales bacterium]|nr:hypothetical protein [Polyangiales bacterium]
AEQGCDVCHELHASVYELRCSMCEAAICPDCALLRPNTEMACLLCNARRPARMFDGPGGRPSMLARVREESASLQLALVQLMSRVRSGEGVLANLRLLMRAFSLAVRARLESLPAQRISYTRMSELTSGLPVRDALTRSARRARELSTRAIAYSARAYQASARSTGVALVRVQNRSTIVLADSRRSSRRAAALALVYSRRGRRLGMRVARHTAQALRTGGKFLGRQGATLAVHARHAGSAFSAGARRGWARSRAVGARGLVHTRKAAVHGWVALRSLPVRHHTTALLLATLLFYAVARADHRD